jgi:hypothetical protein
MEFLPLLYWKYAATVASCNCRNTSRKGTVASQLCLRMSRNRSIGSARHPGHTHSAARGHESGQLKRESMIPRIVYLVGQVLIAAIVSILLMKRINQRGVGWLVPALLLLATLWSIFRALLHLLRYIRNPLQKRQEYFVTGQPLEEFVIEPIMLDGPCLLVFKCDIPDTGVKFNLCDIAEEQPYLHARYSRAGVDFQIYPGKAPFRLKAQLPKYNVASFKLTLGRQPGSISAKLTIEIRGHATCIELPHYVQPVVRAFPVLPMRRDGFQS